MPPDGAFDLQEQMFLRTERKTTLVVYSRLVVLVFLKREHLVGGSCLSGPILFNCVLFTASLDMKDANLTVVKLLTIRKRESVNRRCR